MKTVSIANGEHYVWGEGCDGWHLAKTPGLSVIRERVPPGGAEVRHYHGKAEQFFYVLSGVATMETDNGVFKIEADHGLHVPAGVLHRLSNAGGVDLVFLVISTPPSHGDRVVG